MVLYEPLSVQLSSAVVNSHNFYLDTHYRT